MSERADVIVIVGILGWSAPHLREAGHEVVLPEPDDLARATSFAGAGFIVLWVPMAPITRSTSTAVRPVR